MAVAFKSGDPEEFEAELRQMSDEELLRCGMSLKFLCNGRHDNPVFVAQLKEARAEWRRRHPKLPLSESV